MREVEVEKASKLNKKKTIFQHQAIAFTTLCLSFWAWFWGSGALRWCLSFSEAIAFEFESENIMKQFSQNYWVLAIIREKHRFPIKTNVNVFVGDILQTYFSFIDRYSFSRWKITLLHHVTSIIQCVSTRTLAMMKKLSFFEKLVKLFAFVWIGREIRLTLSSMTWISILKILHWINTKAGSERASEKVSSVRWQETQPHVWMLLELIGIKHN